MWSRERIRRPMPPRMAIHTTLVPGGHLKFTSLFGFLIVVFMFIVVRHRRTGCGKFNTGHRKPQPSPLKPLPPPLQAANRPFCELESFRNPHSLQPKHFSCLRDSHYEAATAVSRDLVIGEEVLQSDRTRHPNWLKTVTRLPMPQSDQRTDTVRVETLPSNCTFGPPIAFGRIDSPRDLRPIELDLSCPALQFNVHGIRLELLRFRRLQPHKPRAVAHCTKRRSPWAFPPLVLTPESRFACNLATLPPLPFRRGEGRGEGSVDR